MDIVDNIFDMYSKFKRDSVFLASDKFQVNIERQNDHIIGSFSVILEVIVKSRLNDDDYGIVFSTNCQKGSRYHIGKRSEEKSLHLISDISSGEGEVFASTDEFKFDPFDKENVSAIWSVIESFTRAQFDSIPQFVTDRYKI